MVVPSNGMDLTRKTDLEDLYEMRKKVGTQKGRDEIDLQVDRILKQHPKINALRHQLLNAMRGGDSPMVGKISQHIRHLQSILDHGGYI